MPSMMHLTPFMCHIFISVTAIFFLVLSGNGRFCPPSTSGTSGTSQARTARTMVSGATGKGPLLLKQVVLGPICASIFAIQCCSIVGDLTPSFLGCPKYTALTLRNYLFAGIHLHTLFQQNVTRTEEEPAMVESHHERRGKEYYANKHVTIYPYAVQGTAQKHQLSESHIHQLVSFVNQKKLPNYRSPTPLLMRPN